MNGHVLALCGGVGGAKLAFGLAQALSPQDLTIVVNTGDDFVHLGLHVSPDVDTVIYTLAGLADRDRGWGLAGETWAFMAQLKRLGGEAWFNLGDRDLAMHVERTRRLAAGEALSAITRDLAAALGLDYAIIPMSDDPVRTIVQTTEGELPFQRYFVGEQCRPVATGVRFAGAQAAAASPAFSAALQRRDLGAIVICPSNPYLSVDPILAIPGVREALRARSVPMVAVSPIIGGQALKGPAAKLMRELGVEPSSAAVARHYSGLLDGLVIDNIDEAESPAIESLGIATAVTATVMRTDADRARLAHDTLALAQKLTSQGPLQRAAS